MRRFLQALTLVLFAVLLWRFFPVAIRFVEAAALNLRVFWWLVLLVALITWVIWVWSKRNPG
ncbi:MAG TPA: hypothetical protein VJB59_11265 [Bdellovibrionota bacterium]|nr:hypothetical protein [Bdellovibrionota bacterium]